MSDSDDDWDVDDDKVPELPKVGAAPRFETKGQAVLAKALEPDASKFEGEDEEEAKPAWQKSVPKSEKKKEVVKKYDEARGTRVLDEGTPLDDPVAEKERRQRLIETADLQAAMELFGVAADPDKLPPPKTAKDFEELARAVVGKYAAPHAKSQHLKVLAKGLLKGVAELLDAGQIKDLESALATVKTTKLKEEKAAAATTSKKGTGKKASINVGRQGGSAGLDDYKFTDDLADDVDFM